MRLFDAHNHLHDARLAGAEEEIVRELQRLRVAGAVVNGTRENDWPAVEAYCARNTWARCSFGLHPWHVPGRSADWLASLREVLERHPAAAVGEIGLDRWVANHDLPDQLEVFGAQLALAEEQDRAVTIHCLRAWGALYEYLRAHPLPRRGFLLHAYGGPVEMLEGFVRLGAYFSFSAYFLHPRKAAAREVFRQVPLERLLVETDAPDMAPPEDLDTCRLCESSTGERLNHPGNLALAYRALGELRGMEIGELAGAIEVNYRRLFAPVQNR